MTSDATGARAAGVPQELTAEQLVRLRSYGVEEGIEVGQVLLAPGQADDDLILIDAGRVDVVLDDVPGTDGWQSPSAGPGTFINELNLLTGQRAYLTARVTEAGRIHRVSQDRFRALLGADPDLGEALLATMLARRERLRNGPMARSVELIGNKWSASFLALRTYAARQHLVHAWFNVEDPDGAAIMKATGLAAADLPAVVAMGTVMRRATSAQLGELLGLSYRPLAPHDVGTSRSGRIDLTIVGAGPAGLAAAVYGASEGLNTVVLDAVAAGGQAAASARIENYLGFPTGLSGAELTDRALVQAQRFGARLASPCTVSSLHDVENGLRVVLTDGSEIVSKALIIATGARYKSLPLDRWPDFEGAGIYYAATELEARAHAGQPVVVLGGANSAGQAALHLASRGSAVQLVVRGSSVHSGMSAYLADRLLAEPRVVIRTHTTVTALYGGERLDAVSLSVQDDASVDERVACAALFCFIGAVPATDWLRTTTALTLDKDGFVPTDTALETSALQGAWNGLGRRPLPFETSMRGVFAAGDVRTGSVKRVAAAVGEGASAVRSVHAVIEAADR